MNGEERRAYYDAILRSVYQCDPEMSRASSADISILRGWADREIPLAWILTAVDEMGGRVSSVRHARPAVEQEIERCHRAMPDPL